MKPLRYSITVFVLLCFHPIETKSQWTQTNGSIGGYTRPLIVSGTNLFAGNYGSGVFLSTNNGTSWAAVNNGLTNTYVQGLVSSGTNLFAGTNGGVFLSTNNGTSWNAVNYGLTSRNVSSLCASGTNLFAGTNGGVFLSTNNGTSWTAVNSGVMYREVLSLVSDGSNVYVGTSGGGVFLSTNNGGSWTQVNTGLTSVEIRSLSVGGTNLFAGTYGGGVFLSTNNGTSWTAVNNGLTNTYVQVLASSGTNLFAGVIGGVFLSTNNGTSWTPVGLPNTSVQALVSSGTYLFAGIYDGGVWRRPLSDWVFLLTPANGLGGITTPATFKWKANALALAYAFQISTDAGFSNLAVNQNTADTAYVVSNLQPGTVYFWRVRAENTSWTSDWGVSTFTSKMAVIPQLSSPASGAMLVSTTPTLIWNPVVSTATYTLQVSTRSTFDDLVYFKDTSSTSVRLLQIQGSSTYFWRVRAQTPGDTTAWSSVSSFTTLPNPPNAILLTYPDSSKQDVYQNDWLRWQANSTATSYTVQISTSPLFSALFDSATISGAGYRNPNRQFTTGTTYFWRVRGANVGGNGEFSAVWSFRAGSALRRPVQTYSVKAIDFGRVKVGQNAEQSVFVGNTGNDTLKVIGITTSSPSLSSNQSTLTVSPGATGNLVIRFAPTSGGTFTGMLLVSTNAQSTPDTVRISGFGLTYGLKLSASQLDFGNIKFGQSKDLAINLLSTGNDTLVISSFRTTGGGFTVKSSVPRIAAGSAANDTLQFSPVLPGSILAYLLIESNSPSSPDTVTLYGFGATYGLRLSSRQMDMGLVLVGKSKDTTFSITNIGNDSLRITGISTTAQGITVRPTTHSVLPNGSANDTIRFTPTAVGPVSGYLVVSSNAPTSPDTISISASGVTSTTEVRQQGLTPRTFSLSQNYPNPFNPATTIQFGLPRMSHVSLKVFDLLGKEVAALVTQELAAGYHTVKWQSDVPSGMYIYLLQAGEYVEMKKMILLK